MRFVVVAHGPPVDLDRPVSGGALRAQAHADALSAAGHEVVTLRRAQDVANGYRSPGHLQRRVRDARPDAILCVAVEEAWALRGLAPLCVDLYAPRLLEAAWEGTQAEEAGVALRAVHAADEVLFSNPRQRWFWLGVLGLAGWDLSKPCGRVVPLAAMPGVEGRRAGGAPTVVMGGQRWPWQDAGAALAKAVRALRGRGEVRVYGPPSGVPGVREMGLVGRGEWLRACAESVAVLDRYAPHHEREMALSFRQVDALASGAPLISDPDTPLAAALRGEGAGWVDEPLEDAIEAALVDDRRGAVARVAARYAPAVAAEALLAWEPRARVRGESVVAAARGLAAAKARAEAAGLARAAADAEVRRKREEVDALHAQVRALAGAVEASSAAVADVVALRRETVAVLGARLGGQDAQRERLVQELETMRADNAKKDAELAALTAERDRLLRVFRWRR